MSVEQDMKTRWTPSREQDQAAATAMADRPESDGVYTGHLLVGKEHGWWSPEVEVVPIDGVFDDRDRVSELLQAAAKAKHEETGKPVSGGYTWHHSLASQDEPALSAGGSSWLTGWAVFEDILTVFPIPSWSRRAKA